MDKATYIQTFEESKKAFEEDARRFGLEFEETASESRMARLSKAWRKENAGCSLRRGWMSPACIACRTGMNTATFFISLRCTRHCYFCFNPNQENYRRYLVEQRDIASELKETHRRGIAYDCLAVTGGEPFLHPDAVLDFLATARELYPHAHKRIYTCGDGLSFDLLRQLRLAGLDELRFSVKLDEGERSVGRTLSIIEQAVAEIPDVMVEMPVIPGTREAMENLLLRLDSLGVRGINLLEFCFPLCNAEEFSKRGFKLRRQPFRILYDYWYAGGLPVAGSERLALELLEFARDRNLSLGVHYCSSDNKNTGQVFQQNIAFFNDARIQKLWGFLELDTQDYYLKCAKAFGSDARAIAKWLEIACVERADELRGIDGTQDDFAFSEGLSLSERWRFDDASFVSFPITWLPMVLKAYLDCEFAVAYFMAEHGECGLQIREVEGVSLKSEIEWRGLFLDG